MTRSGSTPAWTAAAAITGSNTLVVAVFEVTSVSRLTKRHEGDDAPGRQPLDQRADHSTDHGVQGGHLEPCIEAEAAAEEQEDLQEAAQPSSNPSDNGGLFQGAPSAPVRPTAARTAAPP